MRIFSFLFITITLFFTSCSRPTEEGRRVQEKDMEKDYEIISTVRLTVGESKRLIAKGITANEDVQERLKNGIVIITLGTTNTRGSFVTGRIFPSSKTDFAKDLKRHDEIVLINGKVSDIPYVNALERMTEKDIVFKGANMLNYAKRQAAVCVGAPDGGTVAKLRKYTDQGKGRWIVPVGLEKETTQDLFEIQRLVNGSSHRAKGTVRLNVTQNNVYTEIEAIKEFADVDVFVTAKGGVDGAEGGVSLLVCGSEQEVGKANEIIRQISGEPAFVK